MTFDQSRNPKVFISHASEDKDRFVREYATGLREKGIDAWFDEWEMIAGDSLVERIFNEGIGQSSTVVVVVSQYSSDKPWVREELSVAKVRQINRKVKLIPLILDDTPVPVGLENLVWLRVGNGRTIEQAVADTVRSVFGITHRPALGLAPEYTERKPLKIVGLRPEDEAVLKAICEASLAGDQPFQSAGQIFDELEEGDILMDAALEVLEILEIRQLVKVSGPISSNRRNDLIAPTLKGLESYLKATRSTYAEELTHVAALLVNETPADLASLSKQLNIPESIAEYYLELFKSNDLVRFSLFMEGTVRIDWVSPELRRMLVDGQS